MPSISRFNHMQRLHDGNYLAFNAATGAVGLMTSENFAVYEQLCGKLSNGRPMALTDEEQVLLGQLSYGGFVKDDGVSECEDLKFRYRDSRYETTSLGLVIAPTMACNMACEYCFESNKAGRMSAKVVEGLIGFVERRAPKLVDFQVTWYGGEPLLALDIIEDLTTAFVDLQKEHGFSYGAGGIMTNGYLLTRENVDRIKNLRVGEVQVTIDGPARIHNRKRPLKNGKDSFDIIMANLSYACTQFPIVIRINVDKSFTPGIINELLVELDAAGLKNRAGIYFGHLEPSTVACANIAESCYETKAYSQTELAYYRLLLDEGFTIEKLPQPILTYCLAQRRNSFLIDPDGDLYRCFNYVGDKSKVTGNVLQDVDYKSAEFLRLFNFDPFEQDSCRDCGILPLCMGGCPARRADRSIDESEFCDSWKYNLNPMLELIAQSRRQASAATTSRPTQETQK